MAEITEHMNQIWAHPLSMMSLMWEGGYKANEVESFGGWRLAVKAGTN